MAKRKPKVICPYCSQRAELIDSAKVYNGRSYGLIWACLPCEAWVGVHKNSPDNKPLGRLANAELRAAKMAAHACFDPLWKNGIMRRSDAYEWLARQLGIHPATCHIGMFDVDRCRRVAWACSAENENYQKIINREDDNEKGNDTAPLHWGEHSSGKL